MRLYLLSSAFVADGTEVGLAPYLLRKSAALPQGLFVDIGGVNSVFDLSPTVGDDPQGVIGSGLGTTAHQDNLMARFVTPPLDYQDLPAGTWTIKASVQEGTVASVANSFLVVSLYLYRPSSDGTVLRIYDSDATLGTEWPITNPSARSGSFAGGAIPGVTWGDRLVLEVWRHARQDDNTTKPQSLFFGGGTDLDTVPGTLDPASYLDTPSTLVFATSTKDPQAIPGGSRVQGKRTVEARWFSCSRCGRHVPEWETSFIPVPYAMAGIRVCNLTCFDDPDYEMYKYGWTVPLEPVDPGDNR